MEWVDALTTLVCNVGFPIAISMYLLKQNKDESDKHEKEVEALRDTLEKNTLAITTLCERLGK